MSMPVPYGEPMDRKDNSPLPADLVHALRWLQSHLSEQIQLETLAQVSGVRPRTLEMHFKMFLDATPFGWLRRMRLARARQELLSSGPEDTVTAIALSSGFNQLGRFAAQYRKSFEELPSVTLLRSRNSQAKRADAEADEAMRLTSGPLPFALAEAARRSKKVVGPSNSSSVNNG